LAAVRCLGFSYAVIIVAAAFVLIRSVDLAMVSAGVGAAVLVIVNLVGNQDHGNVCSCSQVREPKAFAVL
jgi:uncharacterized MnhB-related membrane protein